MTRSTHTYVELEVSAAAYDEIAGKLRAADYGHVFGSDGEIDMHGIALTRDVESLAADRKPDSVAIRDELAAIIGHMKDLTPAARAYAHPEYAVYIKA